MPFAPNASLQLLAVGVAAVGLLSAPLMLRAEPAAPGSVPDAPVEAQFRGCDAAGWCRFLIDSAVDTLQPLQRVRPDGVAQPRGDDPLAVAIRTRLNALLSSMIHQHKRILLHNLRGLDDGTFTAVVTVNETNVASDPILLELRETLDKAIR